MSLKDIKNGDLVELDRANAYIRTTCCKFSPYALILEINKVKSKSGIFMHYRYVILQSDGGLFEVFDDELLNVIT